MNNQLDRLNSGLDDLENPKEDIDGKIQLIDEDCTSNVDVEKPSEKKNSLKLYAQKTDVQKIRKLEEEINLKNNYKYSQNVGYGDMPEVFAFEVENNIRVIITEIMQPIIRQHERVVMNVADLQTNYDDLAHSISKVNIKLD